MASKAGQIYGTQTGNQTGNQSGNLVEQSGKALKGIMGGK